MTTALETRDWAEAAGLKEKPKPKLLDNIAKYAPGYLDVFAGLSMIFLGASAYSGGGIGLLVSVDAEPVLVTLTGLPEWMRVAVIWLGVDSLIFKGRATPWLLNRYITPRAETVLKTVLGEERFGKLRKRLNKDKKEEQNGTKL